MIQLKVQRLSENAIVPKRAHPDDTGYDLYAAHDMSVPPGHTRVISTDIAVQLPHGYAPEVRPRSNTSKAGMLIHLGTIDGGYRGSMGVILTHLWTPDEKPFEVRKGDRIAQLVISVVPESEMVEVDSLSETSRGSRGFGSSGVR